jgi:iron complex outermembrane recepter protein
MSEQLNAAVRAVLLAAAAAAAVPGLARAETDGALEEIIVTAQKREQSALEVPITITAFSAEAIERAGIESFEDYATLTPNIGFTQQGSRAYTKVAIRGVTNIGGKANSVGIYVDEFNIAPNILVNGYSRTADTSLFDVERIEILRGPQGTYFGRNTMGGAISITTRKPEPGVSAGSVSAEVNDRGGYLGRGTVDVPVGEDAALGLTAFYREVAGYLDNKGPSNRIDDGDELGARAALRWTPGEAITVDLSYSHTEETQDFRSPRSRPRWSTWSTSGRSCGSRSRTSRRSTRTSSPSGRCRPPTCRSIRATTTASRPTRARARKATPTPRSCAWPGR